MDQWHNEQLYVPPLPPTNLRGCHLINIQYDIYVSANYAQGYHVFFFFLQYVIGNRNSRMHSKTVQDQVIYLPPVRMTLV